MITFRQLQNGPCGRIAGLDVTSQDFLNYCRDSVRQLMQRGNWYGTVWSMDGCVKNGCITWPREVDTVLALNHCDHPTIMQNHWYRFMQPDSQCRRRLQGWYNNGWRGNRVMDMGNQACCFNPIQAPGFTLRVFITQPTDVGKTITFYGVDANGQEVMSMRPDTTFQAGIQLTLATPSVDTPVQFRHVTRVVKQETDGPLNVYQFNQQLGFLLDFAHYGATETNPEYQVSRVSGRMNGCGDQISALIKMKYVPFKYQDDLVQIDNQDAIRDMIYSLRKKEAGDAAAAFAYETSALRELNHQMRNLYPDENFIVNFRPFGNDDLNNCNVRIGQI